MEWEVDGADEETGVDVKFKLHAPDHKTALTWARARGLLVASIREVKEPIKPSPFRAEETINPSVWIGLAAMLVGWIIPLIGYPLSLVGLYLGFKGPSTASASSSTIGIVLNSVGLTFTLINSIAGAIAWSHALGG